MRGKTILAACGSLLIASVALVRAEEARKATPKKAAPKATIWQAADMKWADMEGAPGVKIADLWGDHTKGAYGSLIKFPAGWSAPLHTHTHDMSIVVISGTFIHTPEGKPEVRLGPGSAMKQPGGGYKHSTACDKASECVFFAESKGAFDLHPVEEAKPAEKK